MSKLERSVARMKKYVQALGMLSGLGLAIAFVVFAAEDVRKVLQRQQLEAGCEAGEAAQCAELALVMLRDDEEYEAKVKGMQMMEDICEQSYVSACRMAATFGQRSHYYFYGNTMAVLNQHRDRVVKEKCEAGDGRACFVWAYVALAQPSRSENVHKDNREAEIKQLWRAAKKLCKARDAHACRAASVAADYLMIDADEVHHAACKAGYADSCVSWGNRKIDKNRDARMTEIFNAEERALLKRVCEETQYKGVCFMADTDGMKRACWNGDYLYCSEVNFDTNSQDADALKAFYQGLAATQDIVGYSYGPVPGDFQEACHRGLPEACFVEGVRLVANYHKDWHPKRASIASLKETFGKACDLGMNAGCLAFGVELLDRPFKKRPIKEANAMLTKACKRGHAYSCWAQNFEKDLRATNTDTMKANAKLTCKATDISDESCLSYVAVVEHELGATPWPMSDRRMAAINLPLCHQGVSKACRDRLWIANPSTRATQFELPSNRIFSRFLDAEAGCKQGNLFSCMSMFTVAESLWPVKHPARVADLKRRVCAKIPDACDL